MKRFSTCSPLYQTLTSTLIKLTLQDRRFKTLLTKAKLLRKISRSMVVKIIIRNRSLLIIKIILKKN